MKLSDYVIDKLVEEGVTHIFEVCGGALAHLLDSMYDRDDIKAISMHHEMAASIAAEGYARTSGNLGVAMATSGPGATNLITGIGSCFFDSIPTMFITGQVNTYEYKFDRPVRQIGFQETDIVNIVKPIVKDATLIVEEPQIKVIMEKLIYTAKNGRKGPVLLDIPLNIQRGDIDPDSIDSYDHPIEKYDIEDKIIKQILDLLNYHTRPIVLAGGGVRLSKANQELLTLINKTNIPVVTTLMGLDSFPHNHKSFIGMIGTYGNRYANLTLANADLVLALGTRLDTRQTGTNTESFVRNAKIIHVDIDENELGSKLKADLPILADLKSFLIKLNHQIIEYHQDPIIPWKKRIESLKIKYPSYRLSEDNSVDPNFLMHRLSDFLPDDAVVCVDVGQNQMWAAQSLEIKQSQRFLTQGGMASIGSALPMAIGASFAKPDSTIVVITGDGGFQLNIQELQTVYHHNLQIKIILLNNYCYGMIKQFQEQYMGCRFQSAVDGYSSPDFQDVVSAFKIPVQKITKSSEVDMGYKNLFQDKKARFLEVDINPKSKALPKLSVNRPIEDQEPLLPIEELKSNMIIDIRGRNED
ncbi:MAG: thiamine pyrophosphate-binding protein [Methanobacterium sp.]